MTNTIQNRQGDPGKTPYQRAVELGLFDGTEAEYNASLQGEDGPPGSPDTPQQVADKYHQVANEFTDAEQTKVAESETTTQLVVRDAANRDLANATGTLAFSQVSGLGTAAQSDATDFATPASVTTEVANTLAGLETFSQVPFALEFEGSTAGWDGTLFSANQTITSVNGRLRIEKTASGSSAAADARGLSAEGLTLTQGTEYVIVIEVNSLLGEWAFRNQFSASSVQSVLSVGENAITFTMDGANGQFPVITRPDGSSPQTEGDFIEVERISIREKSDVNFGDIVGDQIQNYFAQTEYVWIGEGVFNTFSVGQDFRKGILIGRGVVSNQDTPTIVGTQSSGVWEGTPYNSENIHGAASNNGGVMVGSFGRLGGWRTTGVGDLNFPLGQSSSTFGYGAVALASHGAALLRGGYVPDHSQLSAVGISFGKSSQQLYLENAWAHKYNTPYSGIAIGDHPNPSGVVVTFHGVDAFDSRFPAYDPAEDYTQPTNRFNGKIVQHQGNAYKSIGANGPSTQVREPGAAGSELSWRFMHPVPATGAGSGVPDDFNVDAGHSRLVAGRSTGSGVGGTSGISVTDGIDRGPNFKQHVVEGLYVDSDAGNANTHVCLRKTDGTQHRINIEADGTLKAIPRTSLTLNYRCNTQQ